jgi:ribosome recycling factor
MQTVISDLKNDLAKIRTGRANPAILDDIKVKYYGAVSSLREMATITVPEPTIISVKPWDRNSLGDIELAIRNSDLGFSPVNDGIQIRLILPPMTEERRKEIVTLVKKTGEQAKVTLRTVRGDYWSKVQTAEKNGEATEDERYMAEEELNKMISEKNKEIDKIILDKEKEIMSI